MNEKDLPAITKAIMEHFVKGEFGMIEQLSKSIRLSASDVSHAISQYGRHLIMPPESQFAQLDIVRVNSPDCLQWSVRCRFWTLEEGPSDLTLELTICDEAGKAVVEVDDIHVL